MTDAASVAVAARALACLDLTNLEDACTEADVLDLAARASTPHGPVAAICIWPRFVAAARAELAEGIGIATVVAFPTGEDEEAETLALTRQAVADGAGEVDMVIPWRDVLEGRPSSVSARVAAVKEAAGGARVKAILETGRLQDAMAIREASRQAILGGADFLKTSTGKVPVNATPEAAEIMLNVIREADRPVGFKAAGGVRSVEDAAAYLGIADGLMGAGWATPATFRFGASGLLSALMAALEGGEGDGGGDGY